MKANNNSSYHNLLRYISNSWFLLFCFLLVSCNSTSDSKEHTNAGSSISLKQARTLNVQSFQAKGDGNTDDTKSIQEAINAAQKGDTILIPAGTYRVQTLVLKSDINIKGIGKLQQSLPQDTQKYTRVIQNSSAPLFFGRNLSHVSLSFQATTRNEALYISKSKNVKISYTTVQGNNKNIHSFPGMLFYECDSIQIDHVTISDYGAPRQSALTYQSGTGIRLLSCQNFKITNNKIVNNGENGIFMHGSGQVKINNNQIANNGMSAIQIGFGKTKREQHFMISNNILAHNAADAIDINNKITPTPFPIFCTIQNNQSLANGFVEGKSTVDGSGLATLVNVSEVEVLNNQSQKSNRPALYLERCGNVLAEENLTDNKIEIVRSFDKITLKKNTFDALTILANTKGNKLYLTNNQCRTLLLPNAIAIDSLILINNELKNTSLNINMTGNLLLDGNTIHTNNINGAILLVAINSASIKDNYIHSTAGYAIMVRQTAKQVVMRNNRIQSVNACIYDEGSENLTLLANQFISIPGGEFNRTFISKHPNDLRMKGNIHHGGASDNSIRFEGTGTAFLGKEQIQLGYPDYGQVVLHKFQAP